ncbi:MAG: AAA family ATPase [Acidobacteriaceae bacterium]|jgi:hypothetical protein
MKNPFEFGRELGIGELVDREAEVAEVEEVIRSGRKVFLIGPRRFGKTSILKAAEDKLQRANAVVLRLDAESYPTLEMLVNGIVAGAARQLKSAVEQAGEQIRRFFSRLRPELDFSLSDGAWTAKVSMGSIPEDRGGVTLLVEALSGLEALAKAQPPARAVGLVIDEFQKVIELGGPAAEAQIRAAIQRHKRTGYVFAGSKTQMLSSMTMDASRPFYRLGTVRFLGPVPRPDFEAFLGMKFAESGFKVQNAATISLILDLAEDVPYNVQMLAHSCWDQLRDRGSAKSAVLTEAVVRQALELLVRQYDPFYTQLWTAQTSIQQRTLLEVIRQRGVKLQSIRVVRSLGRGSSTVQRSLGALTDRNILREEESGNGIRMRFEDPFFAQWIKLFVAEPERTSTV